MRVGRADDVGGTMPLMPPKPEMSSICPKQRFAITP